MRRLIVACSLVMAIAAAPALAATGRLVVRAAPIGKKCSVRRFSWIGMIVPNLGVDPWNEVVFGLPDVVMFSPSWAGEVKWRPGGRACAFVGATGDRPVTVTVTVLLLYAHPVR